MMTDKKEIHVNAKKKMTGADWVKVLEKHPERAAECDWDSLSGEEWWLLLGA